MVEIPIFNKESLHFFATLLESTKNTNASAVSNESFGSVVSDISELFGHHKKQAPPPPPPPPPKPTIIAQPVQQNVGGSGGLVEASSSTLT